MSPEIGRNSRDKFTPLLVIALTVVLIWFATWGLMTAYLDSPEERGQFGDMFGSINALFSGLAFAGIIYTILLQRKELALQREELVATRQELQRSAEAQEKAQFELSKQVSNQIRAARIHGLSTLVGHYTERLGQSNDNPVAHYTNMAPLVAKRDQFLADLIHELEATHEVS